MGRDNEIFKNAQIVQIAEALRAEVAAMAARLDAPKQFLHTRKVFTREHALAIISLVPPVGRIDVEQGEATIMAADIRTADHGPGGCGSAWFRDVLDKRSVSGIKAQSVDPGLPHGGVDRHQRLVGVKRLNNQFANVLGDPDRSGDLCQCRCLSGSHFRNPVTPMTPKIEMIIMPAHSSRGGGKAAMVQSLGYGHPWHQNTE